MKKQIKKINSILLAFIVVASLAVIPASAASINIQRLPADIKNAAKLDAWGRFHPYEVMEIGIHMTNGDYSDIDKYITDPEVRDFLLRGVNVSMTVSLVNKAARVTINPQNQEKNYIPSFKVTQSAVTYTLAPTSGNPDYTILAIQNDVKDKVNINLFLIYKDTQNNLVALGIIRNESGKKLQIDGIPSIQLNTNGKELASGNPSNFEKPIQLAPHVVEVNNGIYNGLPTMCFIKMTFEPGTYDSTVDISNLDNVSTVYSLDYSETQ